MGTSVPTMAELFPAFSLELQSLAVAAGRSDLAPQVPSLPIVGRCTCGEDSCAQFYTAPPPGGSYGPRHTSLMLPSAEGLIVLDLLEDQIVAIEVLDRPDIKPTLDRIFRPT
jgi:hypothetical protein